MTLSHALRLGAVIVLVLVGLLLLIGDSVALSTAAALDSFALAAWCASGYPWRVS